MKYLLDTNAVSEFRRDKKMNPGFRRWAAAADAAEFAISALTVLELEIGYLRLRRRDPEQAAGVRNWLDGVVEPNFGGAILPVTSDVLRRCAPLHVPDPRPMLYSLLAATALAHGLTMVTRNVRHFSFPGLAVLNPWEAA